MIRFAVLVLAALALALPGCRKADAPAAKSWYDATKLYSALRAEEREGAPRLAGGRSSGDLPLYDLDVSLSDDLGVLRLKERVYFTNVYGAPLSEVVLRVYANAIGDKRPVAFEKGSCSSGPTCTVSAETPSVIVAKLAQPLAVGERVQVELELRAELGQIAPERTTMLAQGLESLGRLQGGKGAGDYGLLARGEDIASLASFYAVLARFSDGKWEKRDASTMGDLGADSINHVKARVEVPADAKVVSSGVIEEDTLLTTDAGSRRQVRIVAPLSRDFALLVSPKFETLTKKIGDVEVRSHFLARDKAAGAKVLDAAAGSLEAYEKLFGRYPFADLDVVEAPLVGGAGGVEFSGLVTIASMLYRPALGDGAMGMLFQMLGGGSQSDIGEMTDSMLEFVTAHEVAHQYWPGLVGSDSRRHPWMDESLAQWSAVMYFRARYGEKRAALEAEREVLANYHTMRLLGADDAAVDRPVEAFQSELDYAGLVYGKGPYLFRELERTVGADAFQKGLQGYVERYRFRTAPPRALVETFATGAHAAGVRTLGRRWLDEKHGDEDLGKPDFRKLIAGWIGEDAAKNLGPELDMAMKLMLKLMAPASGEKGPNLLDLLAPQK